MANNGVSIQIAAVDAFSNTFSAVQSELSDLQRKYNSASDSMAKSTEASAKGSKAFADNTRQAGTEVNTVNGMLGTMAQLVVGAFSVHTIIGFVKESFNAGLQMDSINSKLKVLTGSTEGASREFEFIRAESKRLGLDLGQTAEAYSSFAVATKNTSMEGEAARRMFTAVAEAATALHLPAEQSSRVLYQFQQMLSKGKVNMEDLKTASESFPGLLKQVADALGITTSQLMSQMQAGTLMASDVLPKLADQLHKTYGAAATEAADKGRGALNRFTTAVFELKAAFGAASEENVGGFLKWLTGIVGMLKESITWVQQAKIFWGGLFDKAAAWNNAGGLFGLIKGGPEARAELQAEFDAIDTMTELAWAKTLNLSKTGASKQAGEAARNSQRRRDEAKKTGEELAKIELAWTKAAMGYEAELTADANKEYQERVAAAKLYYDQKKAAAKSDQEEVAWEQLKTAKLKEIEQQHARDYEIIQARMTDRSVQLRKEGLAVELASIQKMEADGVITKERAERISTQLTVSSLRDQYEAKRSTAERIKAIYGDDSDVYKKALSEQQSSHKAYLDANLTSYKKYSDEIKSLDQQMADFRLSIQQKIADLQQRGMTDAAKYADNQKRFDEAVSKSREALAKGDFETAQKYAKMAEDLASRLVDKKAVSNTALQELEKQHSQKIVEIQTAAIGNLTDQQKKSAEIAKENKEFEEKRAKILAEEAATTQGISNATGALNKVEELGLSIMEAKKKALKEIQNMQIDPKNMQINLDQSALSQTMSKISELTKTETKTIIIKTIGGNGETSYTGFFGGGKVGSGSPLRDSVAAMLAKNEWVINNSATSFWGDGIMNAINDPLSAAGRNLASLIQMPQLSPAGAANMGTLNLSLGGDSFPVQAPVNVLNQLTTAVRRMRRAGVQ